VQDFMPVLPHIRRRIVFVLDISGSMAGNKVNQVRKAINNILQDLDNKVRYFASKRKNSHRISTPHFGFLQA